MYFLFLAWPICHLWQEIAWALQMGSSYLLTPGWPQETWQAKEQGEDLRKQVAPSKTLSPQSNSPTSCHKRLNISVLLFRLLSPTAGFTLASCLTLVPLNLAREQSSNQLCRTMMQDQERGNLMYFLLLKLVHSLKTYLVKCPQLVQIASAFRRKGEEVWKFILEWESPIMKYWMLLILFL